MNLGSRERVLRAFARQEPDRVLCWCGASTSFWAKAKAELGLDDEGLRLRLGDDFRRVFSVQREPEAGLSPGATWRSPFGVERAGLEYGQPLAHPLVQASLAELAAYPWPSPERMEGLYYRMYDEPRFVEELLARIVDYYEEVSLRTFEAAGQALDIFFGGQTGPLVGPQLFRNTPCRN